MVGAVTAWSPALVQGKATEQAHTPGEAGQVVLMPCWWIPSVMVPVVRSTPAGAVYVYPAERWQETLKLVDETSPYALTGAVFSRERARSLQALRALRQAAGNFYINDKPTGAVVGQQPFGGARASGTNDKAGSILNLLRWVSPRSIKETFAPPRDYRYPFMLES